MEEIGDILKRLTTTGATTLNHETITGPKQCPWPGHTDCGRCERGNGIVRERRGEKVMQFATESCLHIMQARHAILEAGLPEEAARHTFALAVRDQYNDLAVRILETWEPGTGTNIYLHGAVGTGKTYLLQCLVIHLTCRGIRCVLRRSIDVLDALRAGYEDKTKDCRLKEFIEAPVLLLDDCGKESRTSEWATEQLWSIVDTRYQHRRPVVVSTKYSPAYLIGRWGKNYGPDIVDRLTGGATVLHLAGPSRRQSRERPIPPEVADADADLDEFPPPADPLHALHRSPSRQPHD